MKNLVVSEDVIPIGEFKKQASRLFRRVKESQRPILITQNGSPVSVIIPPEEYDRMQERSRFIAAVQAGLVEAGAGRTLSSEEVNGELDRAFGPLKKGGKR